MLAADIVRTHYRRCKDRGDDVLHDIPLCSTPFAGVSESRGQVCFREIRYWHFGSGDLCGTTNLLTSTGRVGFGRRHIQVGDNVAAFLSSIVPFVTRACLYNNGIRRTKQMLETVSADRKQPEAESPAVTSDGHSHGHRLLGMCLMHSFI